MKHARKLLVTSPRDLFVERDQEVKRLELAVKRAESTVNKDRNVMTERETLFKLTREEKEKRKQGKKHWWLKECKSYADALLCFYLLKVIHSAEKRDLLVRARYDALAADGGKRAVKRAMEKKQKKVGQKEKKSRPIPRARNRERFILEGDSREEGHSSSKRRRVAK